MVTHDLHFHISGEIILNSKYLLFWTIIKDNTYLGFYKRYYRSVFFSRRKVTVFQIHVLRKTLKKSRMFWEFWSRRHTSSADKLESEPGKLFSDRLWSNRISGDESWSTRVVVADCDLKGVVVTDLRIVIWKPRLLSIVHLLVLLRYDFLNYEFLFIVWVGS